MADLEDAYSDLGGRSYSLPSGTSQLSSYGQRVYGRPVESVSSIDTDLQTERALLAVEQQKASTVRQLRDTALASMNLREKNRIEEQAGYVASKLTDIDPHAADFENQITTLYSQFPYGFRDQAINSAINFKRDIRKQYDLVNQNMQREENLQARAAQRAEDMQTKAQQEQEFREYQTFSKSLSPFYQQDFLAEEEKAKQAAKAEGREFGMEDRRGLMASFTQRQAQEKVEQDLKNADLNPDDFRTDSGFDYAGARKALFDFGKRDKQMSEARSIISTLGPSIQKRDERSEEVPKEERDLYQRAIGTMTRLMDTKVAATPAAPPAVGGAAPTSPQPIVIRGDSSDPTVVQQLKQLKAGDTVTLNDKTRTWTETDVQGAIGLPEPKVEEKPVKLENVPTPSLKGLLVPATEGSKEEDVLSFSRPDTLRAQPEVVSVIAQFYPNGVDLIKTKQQLNAQIRKAAEDQYNAQVRSAQEAGNSSRVLKLTSDKQKIINSFVNTQDLTGIIKRAAVAPLAEKRMRLEKTSTMSRPENLPELIRQIDTLEKASRALAFEIDLRLNPEPVTTG